MAPRTPRPSRVTPLLATALLGVALAGCAPPAPPPAPAITATLIPNASPAASPTPGTVTATGHLKIAAPGGKLLAALSPYVRADIARVDLALNLVGGAANPVATTTVPKAQLASAVAFSGLTQSKAYEIVTRAYKAKVAAPLTPADYLEIDNYGTLAASCTTAFTTTLDAAVLLPAVLLTLADQTYSGSTNDSALAVTSGHLNNTTHPPTATIHDH